MSNKFKAGDVVQVIKDECSASITKRGVDYYIYSIDDSDNVNLTLTRGEYGSGMNVNESVIFKVKDIASQRKTTLPTDSKERKEFPLYSGVVKYFPSALAGVAKVSKIGNEKHNPGEPLHHARGKSTDHADCILRHLIDASEDFGNKGFGRDESGVPQVDYIAWRALALSQEWHEKHDGVPRAPGASD